VPRPLALSRHDPLHYTLILLRSDGTPDSIEPDIFQLSFHYDKMNGFGYYEDAIWSFRPELARTSTRSSDSARSNTWA
jgi:hypothetical protein